MIKQTNSSKKHIIGCNIKQYKPEHFLSKRCKTSRRESSDSLNGGGGDWRSRWGGIEEGLGVVRCGDRGVRVVVGVEGAIDGFSAFLQARFAGDLDGDPAQDHRRDRHNRTRDRCHLSSSLFCELGLRC